MAQLDFPTSPTVGQVYAGSNGVNYTYTVVNGLYVWTAASAPALTLTSPGSIAGTASIGSTLTYTTGTATGGASPYAYTWAWKKVSDNSVLQANGATYVVPASLLGDNVYVQLTATDAASATATGVTTTFPVPPAAITSAIFPSSVWNPTPSNGLDSNPGGQTGTYNGTATSITTTGCVEASVNGGAYSIGTQTIANGQSLAVRWASTSGCGGAASGTTITGTITDGTYTNSYSLTVNRKPTAFGFTAGSTSAPLSSVQTSNTVTITGINSVSYVTVGSLTAGASTLQASINGGGFVAIPASTSTTLPIVTGETLQIRFTTGSTASATYTAVVNIGDGDTAQFIASSPGFVVTNTSSPVFPSTTFSPSAGPTASPANTVLTGPPALNGTATATWADGTTSLTATGSLEFQVNGGGYTQASTSVATGNTVDLRWNPTAASSAADAASLTGTLTNSTYTNTYTLVVDKQPSAYTWTDQTSVTASSTVTSNVVTIADINCPAELTYTAGATNTLTSVQASIDGGAFTNIPTSSPGLVINPANAAGTAATTIQLRATVGAGVSTAYTLTTNIGKGAAVVTDEWSVTTAAVVASITTPSITSPANGTTNLNPALNSPAGITLVGSTYTPLNGAGAVQTSASWEVVAGSSTTSNPETSAITGLTQNSATSYSSQTIPGGTGVASQTPVTYSNGKYVAAASVGGVTKVYLSSDGTSWTQATVSATLSPKDIIYTTSDTWFIGCNSTSYLKSTDNGATWTQVASGLTQGIGFFVYTNGILFGLPVVNANNTLYYSNNLGTSWNSVNTFTPSIGNGGWTGLAWNGTTYVLIGKDQSGTPLRFTSSNGTTWTNDASAPGGQTIQNQGNKSINFYNGLFYYFVQTTGGFNNSKLLTSSNGTSWTVVGTGAVPASYSADWLPAFAGTNTIYVPDGTSISVSTDGGANWSSSSTSPSGSVQNVAVGPSSAVAAGLISSNLVIWRSQFPTTTIALTDNTSLSNMVVGDSVVEVGGSADASGTITAIGATSLTVVPQSTAWTNGATVKDTTRTVTVTDTPLVSTNTISATGTAAGTWTNTGFSSGNQTNSVQYLNGLFVAVGSSGTLSTSTNGINWTARNSGFGSSTVWCASYINGKYVIGGDDGKVGVSTDGITWTTSVVGSASNSYRAAALGAGLLALGYYSPAVGGVYTSADASTWTSRSVPNFGSAGGLAVKSLAYFSGKFYGGGNSGWLTQSTDGITWTSSQSNPGGTTGAAAAADALTAAGSWLYLTCQDAGTYRTSDGSTWVSSGAPGTVFAYGDGTYISLRQPSLGSWGYSSNGSSWTSGTSFPASLILYTSAAYGNGLFVIGDGNGNIYFSYGPALNSTLTISGANTDGFALGNFISNGKTGGTAASGRIVAISGTSVTVAPQGTNWAAGQNLYRGATIVSSLTDTTNLTSYLIAQALLATSTTYYARVKYATTNVTAATSSFSGWSSFGTAASFVPSPGAAFGGGYFAGQINDSGTIYNLIVAPITSGSLNGQNGGPGGMSIQYKTTLSADAPTATVQNEVYGGPTTDLFKASAAHPVFSTFINGATGPNAGAFNLATGGAGGGTGIGGFNDWYLPAKNELEILYFNLKPDTSANNTGSGINPNAVPARASNYTAGTPAQTTSTLFQAGVFPSPGGAQAFITTSYYWSTSEKSSSTISAWNQNFLVGSQNGPLNEKTSSYYARAIRRISA